VDAVGKRYIDETVFAADRHGRLRSLLSERKETIAGAAAEDNRKEFRVCGHGCDEGRLIGGCTCECGILPRGFLCNLHADTRADTRRAGFDHLARVIEPFNAA